MLVRVVVDVVDSETVVVIWTAVLEICVVEASTTRTVEVAVEKTVLTEVIVV